MSSCCKQNICPVEKHQSIVMRAAFSYALKKKDSVICGPQMSIVCLFNKHHIFFLSLIFYGLDLYAKHQQPIELFCCTMAEIMKAGLLAI